MRCTVASIGLVVACVFAIPGSVLGTTDAWQPPEPDPTAMDWLRLSSGEWLAGELEGLRDMDLEFDSDELDLLKLDWADVAELRSPRTLTYHFDDVGTYTGTAVMRDGVVTVSTDSGNIEQPREKLLLILAGEQRESDYWSAKVSIGFVTRQGNTNQTDINSDLRVRRQSAKSRFNLVYGGNYGVVEDQQTVNNHNMSATIDLLITAGLYVTPATVNFLADDFQNIDLKTTVAAGLGYAIFRGGDFELSTGLSGGYQNTRYVSVLEGEEKSVENGAIIPSVEVEWDITGDLEFLLAYNAQIGLPDVANTFHHGKVTFSFDILGDIIDLDWGLTWDRAETPRADAEGNLPERDDLRTTLGLGVDW